MRDRRLDRDARIGIDGRAAWVPLLSAWSTRLEIDTAICSSATPWEVLLIDIGMLSRGGRVVGMLSR